MGYFVDFKAAVADRNAPNLAKLWEEYTSSDTVDSKDFRDILELIKKSDLADHIGRHVERAIAIWKSLGASPDADEILRLLIDIQLSNSASLRALAQEFLDTHFASDPLHQEKMRLVGLRSAVDSFKGAISNYLLINHMKKGRFVFHKAGWGVGEVLDISMIREQAIFEFEAVPGRKELSFKTCFTVLAPLPDDHFLSMRFGNPDLLEEKARENPVEVIERLLSDLGPKTAAEIKDELSGLVIPDEEWNRWWQNARNKLKKYKRIQSPTEIKMPFQLLDHEVAHEEKLYRIFEAKPDLDALIHSTAGFLKDFPETIRNSEFNQTVKNKLLEMLSQPQLTVGQKVQLYFLLQDLEGGKELDICKDLFKQSNNPEQIIREIPSQAMKKRALIEIRHVRPDWKEQFVHLLMIVEQSALRDFLLSELLGTQAEAALKKKLEDLAVNPLQHPETFLWYFQKLIVNPSLPFGDAQGQNRFFEGFLILLGSTGQRELIKKMQDILTDDRYAIVRQIMKQASEKEVQEFLLLATKCYSLTDHDIKIIHALAEVAHPALAKKGKKKEVFTPEEEVIWSTQEGYRSLQKKIEQIATVDTVENAKEIEVARAHGDLRENAEFKAALERRDRLQAELKFLSQQISKCRVLTAEDIDLTSVGVGTMVELKNDKGDTITYTLLGPWDADPDRNILSFQSKLAKSLTGLKVGSAIELQGINYKVASIRSAL